MDYEDAAFGTDLGLFQSWAWGYLTDLRTINIVPIDPHKAALSKLRWKIDLIVNGCIETATLTQRAEYGAQMDSEAVTSTPPRTLGNAPTGGGSGNAVGLARSWRMRSETYVGLLEFSFKGAKFKVTF